MSTQSSTPLNSSAQAGSTPSSNALPQVIFDNSFQRVLQVRQDVVSIRLTSGETRGAYSMYEQNVQPRGGDPHHFHLESDETVYVLASEFDFKVGKHTYHLTPGGIIFLPRRTDHSFRNTQRLMGKLLVVVSPGAIEGFWQEMAGFTPGKAIHPQKLKDFYYRHGMVLLEV
jgi:quercetin dioxygenase-like cupin family protein